MRKVIFLGILFLSGYLMPFCRSQSLLDMPESIIYDSLYNRYLISNYKTGDIIQVDKNGNQSYFVKGKKAIQGLEIVGNVVYVGCGKMIRGFDLKSKALVMDVTVTGVNNLNDITADTSGNLYTGDVFGTKIIKISIKTQKWWVFVNGMGINRPNGLFYDNSFNRILVCSYREHSPIQAINLSDSTVSTLTTSNLTNCDGITKDKYGMYYVTSWETTSIYRYDSTFSSPPKLVYTNSCGPADISYDWIHNALAIPLQDCGTWEIKSLEVPNGIRENLIEFSTGSIDLKQCYPNPATDYTRITFILKKKEKVSLYICDATGRNVSTILNEEKNVGDCSIEVNVRVLNPGIYYYYLKTSTEIASKKMIISR
jgi:hypothetical protein